MIYSRLIKLRSMKNIFTAFVILISALGATAQITIDSADLGSIGDQLTVASDTNISGKTVSPASSMTQTFDYTMLNLSNAGTIDFLAPGSTPGFSNFPASNIVVSRGGEYIYGIKTNADFKLDGLYGNLYGTGITGSLDFDPDMLMIPFPLAYNDTYTSGNVTDTIVDDTVTGIFDSLRLKSVRQITSLVDAFGTLNLPTMSDNVLRKYDVEVSVDSLWGQVFGIWQPIQQSSTTRYYYRFLAKNKSYYVLEVEADANGNVMTASYQTGASLVAGITNIVPVSCYGGADGSLEAEAIGGTPPYTYAWSSGQATAIITGLAAGTYTVTATDGAGATYTAQQNITQPDSITIVSTQIGPDHGLTDGFIYISASGGAPSYNFVWSNGKTTQNIDSLAHGSYTVTATDNNGCSNSATFEVDNLTSIADINNTDEVSLYPNPSNGQLTIQTSKKWNVEVYDLMGKRMLTDKGNGTGQMDLSGLNSGIYYVLITIDNQVFRQSLELIK